MTRARASRLAANVVRFGRILREAGLPIGPGKVLSAVQAAALVGIERQDDFRYALEATLLDRADQRALFHQAFALFWRDPKLMERALQLMLPQAPGLLPPRDDKATLGNRLAYAFTSAPDKRPSPDDTEAPLELDAALSVSPREVLQRKDFETMTIEELHEAKRMLRHMHLSLPSVISRRHRAHRAGHAIDFRGTLRLALKYGGEWLIQRRRESRRRPSALIVLCDISGSMSRYSRMLLHFLHAVGSRRGDFHAFTFGTRLTNITRALRHRDVDHAVEEVSRAVADWSGGTRIGECLRDFNRRWARRLLAQGAVVLIVSDGLDCGEGAELAAQMKLLRGSCKRIVWLNPLLRFDGFQPRATGIRSMLPHVDHFLPAHNIVSLSDLGRVFSNMSQPRLR